MIKKKYINYFWIEYEDEECKKKWSLFYKDYDFSYTDIHIIPGLEQEWKKNKESKKNCFDENDLVIVSGNGKKIFCEYDWEPQITYCESDVSKNLKKNELDTLYDDFNGYFNKKLEKIVVEILGGKCGRGQAMGMYKAAKVFIWENIMGTSYTIFPYTIIYINDIGYFTQYGKYMFKQNVYPIGYVNNLVNIKGNFVVFDINDLYDKKNAAKIIIDKYNELISSEKNHRLPQN